MSVEHFGWAESGGTMTVNEYEAYALYMFWVPTKSFSVINHMVESMFVYYFTDSKMRLISISFFFFSEYSTNRRDFRCATHNQRTADLW